MNMQHDDKADHHGPMRMRPKMKKTLAMQLPQQLILYNWHSNNQECDTFAKFIQ